MQEYQERVVAEKKELDERIEKLQTWLDRGENSEEDFVDLQIEKMKEYSEILRQRIAQWTMPILTRLQSESEHSIVIKPGEPGSFEIRDWNRSRTITLTKAELIQFADEIRNLAEV